jgi:alpha-amylase
VATEFAFANELGKAFRGETQLTYLSNFGAPWGFLNSTDALVFIDNHDNQRSGGGPILTYKSPRQYKMATAFAAAFPYGHWRMMSSFEFSDTSKGET